jgi:tRNA(Ile)-lysidine synthase
MIKLLAKVPKTIYLGLSGGVDSVGAYTFLSNSKRNIIPVFFDHGTETSKQALSFLKDLYPTLQVGTIQKDKDRRESWEEYWRNERYTYLYALDQSVVICHHLDDVVETWLFSSIHGQSKLIPVQTRNIIRPFLITDKSVLKSICIKHKKEWIEDESNEDLSYMRNRIRQKVLPEVLQVNPGIKTTLRKKYLQNASQGNLV